MSDNTPLTRADVEEILTRAIAALEERLLKCIDRTETKLLTAFHGWARPAEIRMRGVNQNVSGFDERLALLEERVSRIERGDKA